MCSGQFGKAGSEMKEILNGYHSGATQTKVVALFTVRLIQLSSNECPPTRFYRASRVRSVNYVTFGVIGVNVHANQNLRKWEENHSYNRYIAKNREL